MSIVTIEVEDMSNYLCKRFATLVSSYFDHPADARSSAAQVPLENLFRVLEMFRNETFYDESHKGVLVLENPVAINIRKPQAGNWHQEIETAVNNSILATFGDCVSRKEATCEIQGTLRRLVTDDCFVVSDPATGGQKDFLVS